MSLDERITEAHDLVDQAIAEHGGSKSIVAMVGLFSGGNDSTVLGHLMRERATHFAHCNTGIGIEETRVFVRQRVAEWDRPLLEVHPPTSYRDLVIAQGFPGPAHHYKMYQRLKERGLRLVRKQLVGRRGRTHRVVFLAGRRRAESNRRANVPEMEREGSVIWSSPLAMWTDEDMAAYRERFPEIPRNEVSDMLHMSGECLCGAFATKGELEEIRFFFPEVAAEIDELSVEVSAAGVPEPRCQWGWGAYRPRGRRLKSGPLCDACDGRVEL